MGVLWRYSPAKAQPILDDTGAELPGSISTLETLKLGGVTQHLIIRGRDANAPVMLFLHGGPGSPEYPMLRQTNLGLEDDFVMVYWEQRGAGKSYDPANPPADMSIDAFIADTIELSAHLRSRFGKNKIYLMGHSWGSLLGLLTIHQAPEHFHAYFGLGNVSDPLRGEHVALEWAKARADELGDTGTAKTLGKLAVPAADAGSAEWMKYLRVQRPALDAVGGGMTHKPTSYLRLSAMLLSTREYSMRDKFNYMRGVMFSLKTLFGAVINTNLFDEIDRVEVPVHFLQGAWDYQTPYPLARALFDHMDGPEKTFTTFEHSAHSPIMEEPDKFNAYTRQAAGLRQVKRP